jgi:hypothetical protein
MGLTHRQVEIDHRIVSELLFETRMTSDAKLVLDKEVPDLIDLGGISLVLEEFTKKTTNALLRLIFTRSDDAYRKVRNKVVLPERRGRRSRSTGLGGSSSRKLTIACVLSMIILSRASSSNSEFAGDTT